MKHRYYPFAFVVAPISDTQASHERPARQALVHTGKGRFGLKCMLKCLFSASLMLMIGCGSSEQEVATIAQQLGSAEEAERYEAAKELVPHAKAAVPHLAAIASGLSDSSDRVRYRCAKLLAKMGPAAAPAVSNLAAALADENKQTRYYAAKALSAIGDGAEHAMDRLITATSDADDRVRYYAIKALGNIEVDTPAVRECLDRSVREGKNDRIRNAAKSALRKVTS